MLAFLDLAAKNQIEAQDKDEFPKELKGTKGKIWLYKNHNPGLSFGVLKECPKAMELVPLCITSAFGGAWTYILGKRGCFFEKLAATLVMAGGVSNLYDRMRRGHVVDYLCLRWKALKKVFKSTDMPRTGLKFCTSLPPGSGSTRRNTQNIRMPMI